jgi:hypothetical protein
MIVNQRCSEFSVRNFLNERSGVDAFLKRKPRFALKAGRQNITKPDRELQV